MHWYTLSEFFIENKVISRVIFGGKGPKALVRGRIRKFNFDFDFNTLVVSPEVTHLVKKIQHICNFNMLVVPLGGQTFNFARMYAPKHVNILTKMRIFAWFLKLCQFLVTKLWKGSSSNSDSKYFNAGSIQQQVKHTSYKKPTYRIFNTVLGEHTQQY